MPPEYTGPQPSEDVWQDSVDVQPAATRPLQASTAILAGTSRRILIGTPSTEQQNTLWATAAAAASEIRSVSNQTPSATGTSGSGLLMPARRLDADPRIPWLDI